MRMRGFLATAAAALVCCVTLGCPPAENDDVPGDVDVTAPAEDDNTTDTAPIVPAEPVEGEAVEGEAVEDEDVTEVEVETE